MLGLGGYNLGSVSYPLLRRKSKTTLGCGAFELSRGRSWTTPRDDSGLLWTYRHHNFVVLLCLFTAPVRKAICKEIS
jgi:hypothetical protein